MDRYINRWTDMTNIWKKNLFSLGGQRTEDAKELMYARQSFVTQVKSLGLQAIDLVSIDYKSQ